MQAPFQGFLRDHDDRKRGGRVHFVRGGGVLRDASLLQRQVLRRAGNLRARSPEDQKRHVHHRLLRHGLVQRQSRKGGRTSFVEFFKLHWFNWFQIVVLYELVLYYFFVSFFLQADCFNVFVNDKELTNYNLKTYLRFFFLIFVLLRAIRS